MNLPLSPSLGNAFCVHIRRSPSRAKWIHLSTMKKNSMKIKRVNKYVITFLSTSEIAELQRVSSELFQAQQPIKGQLVP
jgi:hypothetical protein